MNELASRLHGLGLSAISEQLDDLAARAQKHRWSLTQTLEYIVVLEEQERSGNGESAATTILGEQAPFEESCLRVVLGAKPKC